MNQIAIASPCTGVCKLDDATGWCLGCGRSGDEMDGWRSAPPERREAIWSEIPARLAQLGVACRRLPWTTQDIRSFVANSLAKGSGTWLMGVVGAVAEFVPAANQPVAVDVVGDIVTARTRGGALRMVIDDGVRALTFDPPATPIERCRIVLAVKRERGRLQVADGVRDLGEDPAPLVEGDPGLLFDLGLGRKEARFCVRVAPGRARAGLEAVAGRPFLQALPTFGPVLMQESPSRVIETALGRIDVQGPIPRPDERSPDGPHTHLLPDHLATSRAMPVGMNLPRAYLPGAVFYPKRS